MSPSPNICYRLSPPTHPPSHPPPLNTWLPIKSFPLRCLHVICDKREREETTENTAPERVLSLLIALQISLQICLDLLRVQNFETLAELRNRTSGPSEKPLYVLYFGRFRFKPSRVFCLFLQRFVFICLSFSEQTPGLYILLSQECSWTKLLKFSLNTQRKSKSWRIKNQLDGTFYIYFIS